MSTKKCEGCEAAPPDDYGLLDYCAICSRDLCDACMNTGCCGNVPALSGTDQDCGEAEP